MKSALGTTLIRNGQIVDGTGAAPPGWSFASDLEHGAMGRTLVLRDIVESVLVGGDFRVLKRSNVRVALRGKWHSATRRLRTGCSPSSIPITASGVIRRSHFW